MSGGTGMTTNEIRQMLSKIVAQYPGTYIGYVDASEWTSVLKKVSLSSAKRALIRYAAASTPRATRAPSPHELEKYL